MYTIQVRLSCVKLVWPPYRQSHSVSKGKRKNCSLLRSKEDNSIPHSLACHHWWALPQCCQPPRPQIRSLAAVVLSWTTATDREAVMNDSCAERTLHACALALASLTHTKCIDYVHSCFFFLLPFLPSLPPQPLHSMIYTHFFLF